MSTPALSWKDWRVEAITLDTSPVLRIKHGRYLVGYARTLSEALALLARNGVPLDQLTPETTKPDTDDPDCE